MKKIARTYTLLAIGLWSLSESTLPLEAEEKSACEWVVVETYSVPFVQRTDAEFYQSRIDLANSCLSGRPQEREVLGLAYGMRAWGYSGLLKPQAAIENFEKAIELKADFVSPYRGIVVNLSRLNRMQDALAWIELMHNEDPTNTKHLVMVRRLYGITYFQMGRYRDAVTSYSKALDFEVSKNDYWTLRERGRVYRAMEKYDEAIVDFTPLAAHRGYGHLLFNERAKTYIELGQFDLALADVNASLDLVSGAIVSLSLRCLLKVKYLGKVSSGLKDCDASANQFNDGYWEDVLERAIVFEEIGMAGEALADFRLAEKQNPFDPRIRAGLARLEP